MSATDSREDEASRTGDRQSHKTDGKTSSAQAALLGLLPAASGVITGVAGFPWRKSVAVTLAEMVLIPVTLALAGDWGWRRRAYAAGAAAALVAGAVVVFLLPASRPGYADIGFSPHRQRVPFCASFEGHGSIPRGRQLLIFDQGAVPGHDGTGNYAFEGVAVAQPGGGNWSISNIQLGAPSQVGHGGELTAVLGTDQTADFINKLWYSIRDGGYWESGALPGTPVSHLDYVRDLSHTAKCPS